MIRLFSKKKRKTVTERPSNELSSDMQPKAVREALEKASEEKPFIYQQVTGRELHANITEALSEEDVAGRAQTALGVMASLAGFACLSSVYLKYERGEISPDEDGFRMDVTPSGRRMFFGDLVENSLFSGEMSIWGMVKKKASELGADQLPDMGEICNHVENTYKTDNYGIPNLPKEHQPRDIPSNFVRYLMPCYLPLLQRYDSDADKFPISFGFAIQAMMEEYRSEIDPSAAARLVMECAIPMSMLDPAEVY